MINTDIKVYLTVGSGNGMSLGGVTSATQAGETLHALFDYVTPEEAADGNVLAPEYRAVDVKNTHLSETLYGAVLYISSQTSSGNTSFEVAYDTGTQSVVNENTAPSAPALTFSIASTKATGIVLGDMAPSVKKRVWVKWIVSAGAVKMLNDTAKFKIEGGVAE